MYHQFKNQRNQDFDIIIVDDGSIDASTEILQQQLATYDKDVTFVQIEHNLRHAHARNVALDYVDTPICDVPDADDHQKLCNRLLFKPCEWT